MFIQLKTRVINLDAVESFAEGKLWFIGVPEETLILDEEDYKTLCAAVFPVTQAKKAKKTEPKNELQELFEELHILTGGKGKTIFTPGREKKLGDLLAKHRMTVQDVKKAATNIGQDAWLQGDNDSKKRYGDVDYLLRPDKAAKWAEAEPQKKKAMF